MAIPKKIAVTGGIASGKSTICRLLEELGAYYISADAVVHRLLVPTTNLGKDLISLLGKEIVVGGALNRERIAQKVFCDLVLLEKVEKRIHPEVQKVIETQYKAHSHQISLFVAEIPLLFEAGLQSWYDKIIVVVADEKSCRERAPYDEGEFTRRSRRLISIEEKIKKADFVIHNSGDLETLRKTIQPLYFVLKENI